MFLLFVVGAVSLAVCCVSLSIYYVSECLLYILKIFVVFLIRVCCVFREFMYLWKFVVCLSDFFFCVCVHLQEFAVCLSLVCNSECLLCLWEFVVCLGELVVSLSVCCVSLSVLCVSLQMWMSALLWLVRYADLGIVSTVLAPSSVCVWKAMSSPLTRRTVLVSQ